MLKDNAVFLLALTLAAIVAASGSDAWGWFLALAAAIYTWTD